MCAWHVPSGGRPGGRPGGRRALPPSPLFSLSLTRPLPPPSSRITDPPNPPPSSRPLLSPCKCSGSIGLVHQDCLESWLEVTSGGGRCELCSHRFRFRPVYAGGAPSSLAAWEVALGLARRAVVRLLPLLLRLAAALAAWLVALPLGTAYLYHGWIRSPAAVRQRWDRNLLAADGAAGAVLAAVVVIGFLSLMSLADFLRFNWAPDRADQGDQVDVAPDGRRREERADADADADADGHDGGGGGGGGEGAGAGAGDRAIEGQMGPDPLELAAHPFFPAEDGGGDGDGDGGGGGGAEGAPPAPPPRAPLWHRPQRARQRDMERRNAALHRVHRDAGAENNRNARLPDWLAGPAIEDVEDEDPAARDEELEQQLEDLMRAQEEEMRGLDLEQQELGEEREPGRQHAPADVPGREGGNLNGHGEEFEGGEPDGLPPDGPLFNQEEEVDVEFQVALDELLGLRGPIGALIRNVLWLLAFILFYLGVFGFLPHRIGTWVSKLAPAASLARSIFRPLQHVKATRFSHWGFDVADVMGAFNETELNASSALVRETMDMNASQSGLTLAHASIYLIRELNSESMQRDTILRLSDVATIVLGYLGLAICILLWNSASSLYVIISKRRNLRATLTRNNPNGPAAAQRAADEHGIAFGAAPRHRHDPRDHAVNERQLRFTEWASTVLEYTVAVNKVCVLLFIKMLVLPITLGAALDIATLELAEATVKDRFQYAGSDLFGSLLLHWVVGITFMLLVTVSVLQLREVTHPEVLGGVIRPQEPQPDLVGNLLKDGGIAHAKRFTLSFGIYLSILLLHIWLPTKLLVASGIYRQFPLFRPRIWQIVLPQLQLPIELLIFHLSMLAVLEKYKNKIGRTQHKWLVFVCYYTGLTNALLPREVEKFSLVGYINIYHSCEIEGGPIGAGIDDKDDKIERDPFWAQLVSLHEKGRRTNEFIEANLKFFEVDQTDSSTIDQTDRSTIGVTTDQGKRLLDMNVASFRLPSKPGTSESSDLVAAKDSEAKMISSLEVPAEMGPYRFQALPRYAKNSRVRVFKETYGNLIPRPPDGWDDLDMGGAEAQGRWAWSTETKSMVEEGVACRELLFRSCEDGERRSSTLARWGTAVYMTTKLVFVAVLSWCAFSVVLVLGMIAPLVLGRFVFFLLQLPDRCHHDPLAVFVGVLMLSFAAYHLAVCVPGKAYELLVVPWSWLLSFRPPPRGSDKALVVFKAISLWFAIFPILVGLSYQLFFIEAPTSWHRAAYIKGIDLKSLGLAWGVGSLLLNTWAILCYLAAFRKVFWLDLFFENIDEPDRVVPEPAANEDNIDNDRTENNGANELAKDWSLPWQGGNGRIACFFRTLLSVVGRWEWDKVDKVVLLRAVSFPVFRQLLITLFGPILAHLSLASVLSMVTRGHSTTDIAFPLIGLVEKAAYRKFFYRCFVLTTIATQLSVLFRGSLKRWFSAAHKAARDERYLIGEVLLNFDSQMS